MRLYNEYLRWMYRSGRPNLLARVQNRVSAVLFTAGIMPRRVATLGVRGRRSGRLITFPVAIAELDGNRYLVSMLGAKTNWVRNVAAADGHAVLRHGRTEAVRLTEVEPSRRAPILREYLRVAPGARPHIPVDRHASDGEFERIAADFPTYRIDPEPSAHRPAE